ncbi:MAG: cytochrome c oxidase subunit 3 [Rickettsiella sp.]|nr:cytochrome c oxidase subunit 3 [Rickettsiella sp.]
MENKTPHYYIPHQSAWPIIGALALLILALGSLNLSEKWGFSALVIGFGGLLFMIGGWLWSVIKESNAGLYNQQMDKTFRWGMFWFLIAELFLFGLLLGSIFHVRFSITPWLAGQSGDASVLTHYLLWPDFYKHWPLVTPPGNSPPPLTSPSHNYLISMRGIPFINSILLVISSLLSILSLYFLKKTKHQKSFITLNAAILLGILFLTLQTFYFLYLAKADIIIKTGVYGSFLIAFIGLHLINVIAALLFFIIISVRMYDQKVSAKNTFSLDAGIWWWCFLAGIWLLGFLLIF